MRKLFLLSILSMPGLFFLAVVLHSTVSGQVPARQGKPVPAGFRVAPDVLELHQKINEYRQQNNLPPIRLSRSLCYVAALHVKDLSVHHPDKGSCNAYSWSDQGSWKPFCYPRDETKKNSVWNKPRELTRYPAQAFEIVYSENVRLIPDTVFMVWKTEEYFNNFLLNGGKWKGVQWNALGIAFNDNYASAWFGEAADPEEIADQASSPVEKVVKDTVKKTVALKKTPQPLQPDTVTRIYYIIVKTNLSLEAATRLVRDLKATDYPQARVLTQDKKIRVSVFESPAKTAAVAKLREARKRYHDAWLFRSEQKNP
jgi:hypothetical protein